MTAQIKQAKAIMGAMSGTPIDMNMILQQYPQAKQVIHACGSVDGAIRLVCQQKGIDYQEFIEAVKHA